MYLINERNMDHIKLSPHHHHHHHLAVMELHNCWSVTFS